MKTRIYTAYGLCIHSEIELPELPEADGSADIVVKVRRNHSFWDDSVTNPTTFVGSLDHVGRFVIRDGCDLRVQPFPQVTEAQVRLAILGPALSVILRQRGFLVLHASSVALGDGAIAFMGHSGWGKSTLAAAFFNRGYTILTDDVLAVDLTATRPVVTPSYPQLKLWLSAADSLGYQEGLSPLFPKSRKYSYPISQQFQRQSLPLTRLYVLAKGDTHSIRPLSEQAAFAALVRHTRAMQAMADSQTLQRHVRLCGMLMRQVAIQEFARKPDLGELPRLVDMVIANHQATTDIPSVERSPVPPHPVLR